VDVLTSTLRVTSEDLTGRSHDYTSITLSNCQGTDIVKHGKSQKESSGINVVKRPAMVGRLS